MKNEHNTLFYVKQMNEWNLYWVFVKRDNREVFFYYWIVNFWLAFSYTKNSGTFYIKAFVSFEYSLKKEFSLKKDDPVFCETSNYWEWSSLL